MLELKESSPDYIDEEDFEKRLDHYRVAYETVEVGPVFLEVYAFRAEDETIQQGFGVRRRGALLCSSCCRCHVSLLFLFSHYACVVLGVWSVGFREALLYE